MNTENFTEKKCQVCEGGISALNESQIEKALIDLKEWSYDSNRKALKKTFQFKGFLKTMSFVNAVAWLANAEGHHPDLEVSFNRCTIYYQTHAANGVTENDFICAAKINELLE